MYQKLTLIGRLAADPEKVTLPSGDLCCTFSVATNKRFKNKDGEYVDSTEWFNLKAFKGLAEVCGEYLKKGSLAFFEAEAKTNSWDDKNTGEKKYRTEWLVQTMKMLDKKEKTEDAPPF